MEFIFDFEKEILRFLHVKEGLRDFFAGGFYNVDEVMKMRDLGKNIKDLRVRAKLTQEELAEKLFVTRQTVSNYENGKSRPDVDMIVRIGETLGADANTVIYGVPKEQNRRTKYRRAIILTVVVLVLSVFLAWLYLITKSYQNHTYYSLPFYLVADVGLPALWVLIGWWLMEILSLIVDFKMWNHILVRYIRVAAAVVLAVVAIILIADLVFYGIADYLKSTTSSVCIGFPHIPFISDISYFVVLLTYKHPIIYSVFGIVFRLFGLPKHKKI